MTKQELELRVLRLIERAKAGEKPEDAFYELKRQLPDDPFDVARQIAGHANAAGGEPIVWIVGVDEKTGGVYPAGVDRQQLFSQIERFYDDRLRPETIYDFDVATPEGDVTVWRFATDRAPYVVTNPVKGKPGCGGPDFEVPWRDGARIRSASRADLLRILVPASRLPTLTPLWAECGVQHQAGTSPRCRLSFTSLVYVAPATRDLVTIAVHLCSATFRVAGAGRDEGIPAEELWVHPEAVGSRGLQVEFDRPDTLRLDIASEWFPLAGGCNLESVQSAATVTVHVSIGIAGPSPRHIPLAIELPRQDAGKWTYSTKT